MADRQLIVVALGGNAITQPDQEGNVREQFANSRRAAKPLADLLDQGHRLVFTHGNGPQIGNFLLRNDVAAGEIYPLPMEVAVAHVQGGMGFMIAQTLINELAARGHDRVVTTVVTTVLVDHDDPSFRNPTKPIGRPLTKAEAERYTKRGWTLEEVSSSQFRRVVASPKPKRIMEIDHIRRALEADETLVVCGGGGIPIIHDPAYGLSGVRAVIDKDLASALLAVELRADAMLTLTNVDRVCINFSKPDERAIEEMTLEQAQAWLDQGQFPPGSMGPKIQGAIQFLQASDKKRARAVIGPLFQAGDALAGRIGTCITKT